MRQRWHPLNPLLLVLLLSLVGCGTTAESDTATVRIGGRAFTLELALDDDARFTGLSRREHIPADGGMLFVFPDARPRTFVMRECLVPIDILFLGPGGRVITTHAMAVEPPGTAESSLTPYRSVWPAQFAIELAGGTLKELDVKPGDQVDLPVEDLKARAR